MAVIGDSDLLVNLKLAPGAIQKLQREVNAVFKRVDTAATVGGKAGKTATIRPDMDLTLIEKKMKALDQLFAKSDRLNKPGIKLPVDTRGLSAAEASVKQSAKGIGNSLDGLQARANAALGKIGLSLRGLAILFGAGLSGEILLVGIRALIDGLQFAVREASALNESMAASRVTFGAASDAAQRFAQSASAIGLSTREALDATRAFGTLFKGVGATEEEAFRLSKTLTTLSADVASFSNVQGGSAEVAERFRSALVGNFESVEKLGINLRQSDVEQELFRRGIIKSRAEMTSQLQTLGTYLVLMSKLKDPQGDFARTSGELANQQRSLGAEVKNLGANLGQLLTPALTTAIKPLNTFVQIINDLITAARNASSEATGAKKGFIDFFKEVGKEAAESLPLIGPFISAAEKLGIIGRFAQDAAAGEGKLADANAELAASEDALAEALARTGAELAARQKAAEEGADRLLTYLSAQQAVAQADLNLERAALSIEEAERNLARAREEAIEQPRRIRERELALAQARLSQRQAVLSLQDAEIGLTDSRLRRADAERHVLRAAIGQEDSIRGLQRAQEDLLFAEQDFADFQREQVERSFEIEKAHLSVAEAQLALQEATLGTNKALIEQLDAQLALVDAQFDLEHAQQRGRAGARDQLRAITAIQKAQLQSAEAALAPERARLDLIGASLSLRDAELALAKVLSEDEAFRRSVLAHRELEDARLRVRDATLAIEDADIRMRDAHRELQDADRAITRAELELESSRLGLEVATNAVTSAEFELGKEHQRAGDLALALRRAELDLKGAHLELSSATLQAVTAADAFNQAQAAIIGKTLSAEERIAAMRDRFNEIGVEIREAAAGWERFNRAAGLVPQNTSFVSANTATVAGQNTYVFSGSDFGFSGGDAVSGSQLSGFAKGGPMRPGQLGIVGERGFELFAAATGKQFRLIGVGGPELFQPKTAGQVVPHEQVPQFLRNQINQSSSSTSSHTRHGDINTNVYVKETDPDVIGAKISRYIARKSKR